MERITYRITLDTHKNGIQRTLQGFETADNMARRIAVNLTAGGDTYELPYNNTVALIYITTPNAKEPSINECVIKDDTIVYDMLPVVEEGITEMQIKLIKTSTDGAKRVIAAPKFAIEVTKSNTDDESAEQTTTFTALENAVARANAVYDARLVRIEIDEEYTFRAYYADGTVYENDVAGEQIRMLTGYVELMKEHISDAKESAEKASISEENARVSAETAAERAEIAVKSTEEQGNFLEWYTEAKKMVSEEAVVQLREDVDNMEKTAVQFIGDMEKTAVQLQEQIDDIEEDFYKEKVDCITGLKGFYYKAVDKENKIIYLSKEQFCSTSGKYTYNVIEDDGINLLDTTGAKGGTDKGVTVEVLEDGSYTMKGTATSEGHICYLLGSNNLYKTLMTLPAGDYYLFDAILVRNYYGNRSYIFPGQFTLTEDTKIIGITAERVENGVTYNEIKTPKLVSPSSVIVEPDLSYSKNAVDKLLSVRNGSFFENVLTITKVAPGKIYYKLVGDKDPFETAELIAGGDVSHDDFTVYCDDCRDEGTAQMRDGASARGYKSEATNWGASAEGCHTKANSKFQHAQGKYNIPDDKEEFAHIVGNGKSDTERSNAHTVDWEGNGWFAGSVYVGGANQDDADVLMKKSDADNTFLEKSAFTFDAETGTLTVTL